MLAERRNLSESPHGLAKRPPVLKNPALARAAVTRSSYAWIGGAALGGSLLAVTPFLIEFSMLAAITAALTAGATLTACYMLTGRNEDAWRTLAPGPKTIDGAPLRHLLGGPKR